MAVFEPQIESEFNSGLAIIFQLDALEKMLVHATLTTDFDLHYRILTAYFKTLSNQMTPKEREAQIINWDKVWVKYKEIKTKRIKGQPIPYEELQVFDWWEIELRSIKQKHGLGMPQKNERYSGTAR